MTRLAWIALLILMTTIGTAMAGFQTVTVPSDQLGEPRDMLIYTPPGYNPNRPDGYPVIIMLHGAGMTPADFDDPQFELALNFAMQTGQIEKMVLAFPDGSTPDYWLGSFYLDSELYGRFEKYLLHDVVPFIDTHVNTDAQPHERGIAGYSMGGFGALHLARKFPGMWGFAGSIAGPVDLDILLTLIPQIIFENDDDGLPPYDFDPSAGTVTGLSFSMAGAMSPNLDNDPPVDYFLDDQGAVIDDVYDRWLPHFMTSDVTADHMDGLPLYLAVGTADELNLYPGYLAYTQLLDQADVDYTFVPYDGAGHTLTDDMLLDAIVWADDTFASNTAPLASLNALPYIDTLPASGGTLPFYVNVISNLPQPTAGVRFWVDVLLPNGSTVPRVIQQVFTLPAQSQLDANLSIPVPAGAPTGVYTLVTNLGPSFQQAVLSSGFEFSKAEQAFDLDRRPMRAADREIR